MLNTPQLSNIVNIFKDISIRHKMINDFGFGPEYNIGASRPMFFPYMWVTTVGGGWVKSGNYFHEKNYEFKVYIIDKINKGDNNWEDIHSDTEYIINTVLTELIQNPVYIDMNIVADNIDITPIIEWSDDNSNGWVADILIRVPMRYTPCVNPINDIE